MGERTPSPGCAQMTGFQPCCRLTSRMISGKVLDLSASISWSRRALRLQGPSEGSEQTCWGEEGPSWVLRLRPAAQSPTPRVHLLEDTRWGPVAEANSPPVISPPPGPHPHGSYSPGAAQPGGWRQGWADWSIHARHCHSAMKGNMPSEGAGPQRCAFGKDTAIDMEMMLAGAGGKGGLGRLLKARGMDQSCVLLRHRHYPG